MWLEDKVPTATPEVIDCLRTVIDTVEKPSWFEKPPARIGEAGVGTLKAYEWRVLYNLYLPLALIFMWGSGSIHQNERQAQSYKTILDITMELVCCMLLMGKRTQTERRADAIRQHLRRWSLGLQAHFPHVPGRPNTHGAFHTWDFIHLFGPLHLWWVYVFERIFGILQRVNHNHTKRE